MPTYTEHVLAIESPCHNEPPVLVPEPVVIGFSQGDVIELANRQSPVSIAATVQTSGIPLDPRSSINAVERVSSIWEPPMNKFRLAAVCLASLANGFNDAGAGAVIPYMEKHYNIGYAVVSLIFVGQALGFLIAAAFLDDLRVRFGRAKVFGLANALMLCGYIPVVATAPYAVIPIAFFLVGFGAAIDIALSNIFCGGLQNGTLMLGLLHGCYGIGGTISPLIATAIVGVVGAVWSRFYLINLSIAVLNVIACAWTFSNYEKELSPSTRERETPKEGDSALNSVFLTLRMRVVLLGALFIFAYQGAEVSISGWVISFLIDTRGGNPESVGYVSAGFWGGITIGRFILSGPAQRWGEKPFVYGLTLAALAFELLVWLVPNIIGNAVAVSIVGLMLGPIYPCAVAVFMRSMSRREAMQGMVTISAFGSLGGAMAPFLTGLLAQIVGTFVLHPIVIFLFLVMLLSWYGVPVGAKRED